MRDFEMNAERLFTQEISRLKALRDISLLAICYFLAGYIGSSLAVPPGYATIIWPAQGIALCALLARGGHLWPGIWLGSFAFNVITGPGIPADFDQAWPVFAVAASLGIGSTIQALAGFWMARQFADGIELTNIRRFALAALLVVALPSFIAPTIGVGSLLAAEAIDGELVLRNWLTWYFGGLLGVTLTLPILLLSNRSPIAVQWQRRSLRGASSLVAISLIITLLLTFYVWQFISEREHAQAETGFAAMVTNTDEALRHRLQIYQRALQGGAAFVTVNESVSPSEWREYVERLEIARSYPGMRGFGMFEAVADEDLPAFRRRFAREFGDRFEIKPKVEREEHYIINRIEPLDQNLAALGLNLAFEQGRREAIALSMTRDEPVLTRPMVLVQDAQQGAGFLLVLPVLDDADQPSGRWVYSPIVADELLAALTPGQGNEFALDVYHGADTDAPDALLYSTGEAETAAKFELRRTISLAGQPISIRWRSLPPFERRYATSAPTTTLASGLTITVLLGILLVTFLRRESHVVHEVNLATAELAERNRMLEMAEATAHIGHWRLDLADQSVNWSDEVYRLHGLKPDHTLALENAIDFYHPDDRGIVEQSIETAIATCQSYHIKVRLLIENGETRHVEMRGRVETDANAEPAAILGVIIDRTEETLMRERLTETIEEARAADKAKSNFLANMSHEIRTPMTGVIGFTELALTEEQNPVQKRRLQMIADSGDAMLRLLNDLLDFAKIEAKQMAIVSEPTDLRHTLRSCQRLMEPMAKVQNLSLQLEIDPELPPSVVLDKMRLRQIVLNLLGNALKFTEEGEVSLLASVNRRSSDLGDRIFIAVRDTGIGIPADRLEGVFGKFVQADDTTARRYGGTGLGLPISADLAELMGGELRAHSDLGKGSTFTLSLPLVESTEAPAQTIGADQVEDCRDETRHRILVAEDNPVNQELTMAMVEKAGHECDLARNGQEALDAVLNANRQGRAYDMVLMDMQMPLMDGLQASRSIRAAGFDAATLPILAVTANAYSDDIQLCTNAGMQAHLAKPLRFKQLCNAIAHWSSRLEIEPQVPEDAIEEETDPRLRTMFEDHKLAAIEAINIVLRKGNATDEEKQEIARQLHQIAGVAAYFGQETLGETCRSNQHAIINAQDDAKAFELMRAVRERLAPIPAH
jgi:PAS domain S-box-containing protein